MPPPCRLARSETRGLSRREGRAFGRQSRTRQRQHTQRIRARAEDRGCARASTAWLRPRLAFLAAAAAASLASGPAFAVETVTASEALQAARPLPAVPDVNRNRVWLLLVGGATSLFAASILAERAELFPAISKANRALTRSRQGTEGQDAAEPPAPPAIAQLPHGQAADGEGLSTTDRAPTELQAKAAAGAAGASDADPVEEWVLKGVKEAGDRFRAESRQKAKLANSKEAGSVETPQDELKK